MYIIDRQNQQISEENKKTKTSDYNKSKTFNDISERLKIHTLNI